MERNESKTELLNSGTEQNGTERNGLERNELKSELFQLEWNETKQKGTE